MRSHPTPTHRHRNRAHREPSVASGPSRFRPPGRCPGLCLALSFLLLAAVAVSPAAADDDQPALRPYDQNPAYWQYKGEPVILLGGSWQDNLWNHPTKLEEHLDILVDSGGNYLRCTMSSRNKGNVWAFARTDNGKYDLEQWNDEYWRRLDHFLQLTEQRDIIVQVELWDPWDHFEDHQTQGGWSYNPFNPANNITYTADESNLPTAVDYPPGPTPSDHPFFRTVPALQNNQLVLRYQEAYIDKLLSITLQYPHVLYCMNNESGERPEWGDHWARHVRRRAEEAGRTVQLANMRRNEDLTSEDQRTLYNKRDLYTFVDISQNNTRRGQTHWDRIQAVHELFAEDPRPLNNVKIYTFNGGAEASVQRFWRNIFGGCASARFHRPHPLEDPADHLEAHGSGIGLSPRAQAHIKSLRTVTDAIHIFSAAPSNHLLSDRDDNEAYCIAQPGKQYAVYFPATGRVTLDLSDASGELEARWLNIKNSRWLDSDRIEAGERVELETPGDGPWAVVLLPADD